VFGAAVDGGLERDALFRDLSELRKAEDLEAPAVRKDRPVPAHEPLDPAERLYQIVTRPQEQMVRVRKDDLRAKVHQVCRRQCLDRGLRTHRHEHRSIYFAVRGRDLSDGQASSLLTKLNDIPYLDAHDSFGLRISNFSLKDNDMI
jgi:hypothetical protein